MEHRYINAILNESDDDVRVVVTKVVEGYRAEMRSFDKVGSSFPMFDPAVGERALVGVGPTLSDAWTALDLVCGYQPEEQWAFWHYDLFPFTLGGLILSKHESSEGYYKIKGYDRYFRPFAIVPGEAGRSLKSNLDTIRSEYRAAEKALSEQFCDRWAQELKRKGVKDHPSPAIRRHLDSTVRS